MEQVRPPEETAEGEGKYLMNSEIILIDEQDNIIGYGDKLEIHSKELLHRAFSIFIYDWKSEKLLLQKRAYGKYHSGGLWTNACCSHPRKDEDLAACLNDRLGEELGLHTAFSIIDPEDSNLLIGPDEILYCGKFKYYAKYEDLAEHEMDRVFLYSPVNTPVIVDPKLADPEEVAELQWIGMEELLDWLEKRPEDFTAWFRPAFALAYKIWQKQAKEYEKNVK